MAEYILRPSSDDKAEWTESPVGPAYLCLDEQVVESGTPSLSESVSTTTDIQINRQFVDDLQLAQEEQVFRVEGWWYMQSGTTAGSGVVLQVNTATPAQTLAQTTVPSNTAAAWKSAVYQSAALGPSNINNLRLSAQQTGTVTSGTTIVWVEFVRIVTASVWLPGRMPMA